MKGFSKVIVDTCVIVDMMLTSRPRHATAATLRKVFAERKIVARVPDTEEQESWASRFSAAGI